jgi:hypothetical protein
MAWEVKEIWKQRWWDKKNIEIVQNQVQLGGDFGKKFVANANKIEIDLEKIILMIKRQEDVIPLLMMQ